MPHRSRSLTPLCHKPIKKRYSILLRNPLDKRHMVGSWTVRVGGVDRGTAHVRDGTCAVHIAIGSQKLLFSLSDDCKLLNEEMIRRKLHWNPLWRDTTTIEWTLNRADERYTSKELLWISKVAA